MGYHLSKIPIATNGGPKFYVAHKTPAGSYVAISDDDPKDDIRCWMSLNYARSAAAGYKEGKCLVDCIIRVDDMGWEFFAVTDEEEAQAIQQQYGANFGSW